MNLNEKIGVYFCQCGSMISEKVNPNEIKEKLLQKNSSLHFLPIDLICSEDGKNIVKNDITENKIDRVVIAACSPRDHEKTFMDVMVDSGKNPYLMQMVNIREQITWVTEDPVFASAKTLRYIEAAVERVMLHEPLEVNKIDVSTDTLIIGAGPAGMKAALQIAAADRKAILIDKKPAIGGMSVLMEEVFPHLECSPCMVEPVMSEILHGPHSKNIELLTLTEVDDILGSFGNFTVKLKKKARYINIHKCIGCYECIEPCPVEIPNEINFNMDKRKAIYFPFAGCLPNVPLIDAENCLKLQNIECDKCLNACPVEDTIVFDEKAEIFSRNTGAIIIATGSTLYKYPLDNSLVSKSYTALEFERILASNGPTGGNPVGRNGSEPEKVTFIHCAGSLDENHKKYCSEICCQYAFKLNRQLRHKNENAKIIHYVKEIVIPGKNAFNLYYEVKKDPLSTIIRYTNIEDLFKNENENLKESDIIVLCPALVPSGDNLVFSEKFDITIDENGFFDELHGKTDSTQSKLKGVYIAGSCHAPMSINSAMDQGMAATGFVLSDIVSGRQLEISPLGASVNEERCSGCKLCISVCPYKAISFQISKNKSYVDPVLCQACGTCVAACPAQAIKGIHFTNEQILAEMEVLLS